jgi:hypothetical protein
MAVVELLRAVATAAIVCCLALPAVHVYADDGVRLTPWVDSSVGIHTILIGDAQDTDDEIKAMATAGEAPDFVCKRHASCLHLRPVYMPYLH